MQKFNNSNLDQTLNIKQLFNIIGLDQQYGIGTDIEKIKRFRKANYSVKSYFVNRIFTKRELDYCFSENDPPMHLTARFSAKEAIFKALNSINTISFNYLDIEIINDDLGVPQVNILKEELKHYEIKVSLSHCYDNAISFALAIKK